MMHTNDVELIQALFINSCYELAEYRKLLDHFVSTWYNDGMSRHLYRVFQPKMYTNMEINDFMESGTTRSKRGILVVVSISAWMSSWRYWRKNWILRCSSISNFVHAALGDFSQNARKTNRGNGSWGCSTSTTNGITSCWNKRCGVYRKCCLVHSCRQNCTRNVTPRTIRFSHLTEKCNGAMLLRYFQFRKSPYEHRFATRRDKWSSWITPPWRWYSSDNEIDVINHPYQTLLGRAGNDPWRLQHSQCPLTSICWSRSYAVYCKCQPKTDRQFRTPGG